MGTLVEIQARGLDNISSPGLTPIASNESNIELDTSLVVLKL